MLVIEILISTYGSRAYALFDRIPPSDPSIRYTIVHQLVGEPCSADQLLTIKKIESRSDLTYLKSSSLGLSNSRNLLLMNSSGEFCVFCDDDVSFNLENIKRIPDLFDEYCVDVIAGKISSAGGYPGKYRYDSFAVLQFRDLLRVSSIEISFRRGAIISSNVSFDTSFGLGAPYPLGEEQIFLSDLFHAGKKIAFYPLAWFEHPPISSGSILTKNKLEAKGAMMVRVKGVMCGIPYTLFLFLRMLKLCGWRSVYVILGHARYSAERIGRRFKGFLVPWFRY